MEEPPRVVVRTEAHRKLRSLRKRTGSDRGAGCALALGSPQRDARVGLAHGFEQAVNLLGQGHIFAVEGVCALDVTKCRVQVAEAFFDAREASKFVDKCRGI
jgi:hypothetical protein